MNKSPKKSVVVATRGVAVRDFLVFQVKLALEGFRDLLAINISLIAIIVDILSGRGRQPRRFYAVVRWSRRFDGWLRLHSMKGMRDAEEESREVAADSGTRRADERKALGSGDEPPGSSAGVAPRDKRRLGSDADTLVEQFEDLVRKTQRRSGGRRD